MLQEIEKYEHIDKVYKIAREEWLQTLESSQIFIYIYIYMNISTLILIDIHQYIYISLHLEVQR